MIHVAHGVGLHEPPRLRERANEMVVKANLVDDALLSGEVHQRPALVEG